jgi:amino acid transporter
MALPIFASDPLSSVAYAPQELLLMLTAGGLAFLAFAPWVATAVVALMVVVVVSYRQLIRAYPSGGGDYEVASRNLGEKAGLVVASALLVDYVLTVAVSVASGVDNVISAFPELNPGRIEIAVACVVILVAVNLRGVAESSRAFALPTYFFIASVGVMIVVGVVRSALGNLPPSESAGFTVAHQDMARAAVVLLFMRAFASGCAALTGVEAIANGVPAFRKPKAANAQRTLVAMGAIAITLFIGVTYLALKTRVHYAADPCALEGFADCATTAQRSVMAQIAASVFGGDSSLGFFVIQATTAMVLFLAANTAFNGFPSLGSVLARDRYAPKALLARGDRLVFSNGVIILGSTAVVFLVATRADLNLLVQMYIIGVFVSFTFGQSGMVVHWTRQLRRGHEVYRSARTMKAYRAINLAGAIVTGGVLIIVTITKFTHGAWVVFVLMPVLWWVMRKINRYYADVDAQIAVEPTLTFGSAGDHAIVLVHKVNKPTLKALDYAIAANHASLEAVHVDTYPPETEELMRAWDLQRIRIPLTVLPSPYRDVSTPLITHLREHRERHGSEVVSVYIPQYVFGHWWEGLLHNRKARRIRHRLVLCPGVAVVLVPWLLDSSRALYTRPPRPVPGLERRGVSALPVVRRQAHEAPVTADSEQPHHSRP